MKDQLAAPVSVPSCLYVILAEVLGRAWFGVCHLELIMWYPQWACRTRPFLATGMDIFGGAIQACHPLVSSGDSSPEPVDLTAEGTPAGSPGLGYWLCDGCSQKSRYGTAGQEDFLPVASNPEPLKPVMCLAAS